MNPVEKVLKCPLCVKLMAQLWRAAAHALNVVRHIRRKDRGKGVKGNVTVRY